MAKWFTTTKEGTGFVFTLPDGTTPRSYNPIYDISATAFTEADGPILIVVDGVVQIDPAKQAAKIESERQRDVEQQLQNFLRVSTTVIDGSNLQDPIKTLLKRMVKLIIRDL